MSVHYAPQETGGTEILQTAMNFDRWMAEHRQALLQNQLAQSQLQEQAARTDLVKTEAALNRGKLGEFNDTSTQRRALLDAQVQSEQNTAAAEGSKAAILKNQADRIPLTNANDDELFKAAQAKAKLELEKLGVDNTTAKLRLLQETPNFFAALKQSQAQTEQIQAHTQLVKTQMQGVQQNIVNENITHAAALVKQAADGEIPLQDFEAAKNSDLPFAKYLQPFSGQERGPKTMDEWRARVAQNALSSLGQTMDPTEQTKITNLLSTLVDPSGVPMTTPPKMLKDPKTGQDTSFELTPAKTVRSMQPIQDAFSSGFGAMFSANKKQNVDVSAGQPQGNSIGQALSGQQKPPIKLVDPNRQTSGYNIKAAEDALYNLDRKIKSVGQDAELPWMKNKSPDNFFTQGDATKADFVAGVVHDPQYMVGKGGEIYNSTKLNTDTSHNRGTPLSGISLTDDYNPLKDKPDFVKVAQPLFKNGMNDPTATAGQTARFATWAGQLARGYNEGGVTGLKTAFSYFDDHFPANSPRGITTFQAMQLAKLVKSYGGQ